MIITSLFLDQNTLKKILLQITRKCDFKLISCFHHVNHQKTYHQSTNDLVAIAELAKGAYNFVKFSSRRKVDINFSVEKMICNWVFWKFTRYLLKKIIENDSTMRSFVFS